LTEEFEAGKLKRAEDDCLPQLIWKVDVNCDAISLNNRFLDYTGIAEDQIESTNVFGPAIVHPDELSSCKMAFKSANEDKEPFEVKHRYLGKDGNYKWMITRGSPILDDDNEITFWCGSCTDIDSTERVQVFYYFL
jgi:PAS domain S-box-containing protein